MAHMAEVKWCKFQGGRNSETTYMYHCLVIFVRPLSGLNSGVVLVPGLL